MTIDILTHEKLLFHPTNPDSQAINLIYAFPNTYAVGITSLGYQSIWANFAQRSNVRVCRYFTDLHEPLPRSIDLVGFSFSWELDYGNILHTLEKLAIPYHASERTPDHPLVFAGGVVVTANPEPFSDWFDFILLGDGEDLIGAMLDTFQAVRGADRATQLKTLACVAGIYVPSLYEVQYGAEKITAITPIDSSIPAQVKKQTYRGKNLSHSTVVTPHSAWENIFMVEVVRSCPEMCRFCLASYLTLPFRTTDLDTGLIPAIDRGLQYTDRLGLLGASITQHPQFPELLERLDRPAYDHIRLSLASVRTNTLTPQLAQILAKHDSRSVTVAVESGSERLRQIINKKLTNGEILTASANAQAGGLQALKFYGMVGVPHELDTDIEATIVMLQQVKKTAPKLRLAFGCSTFVPKAHTPWQWHPVNPKAEKKLQYLQKKLTPLGIEFRPEHYRDSVLQALISRGDRRINQVLFLAYTYAKAESATEPSLGMVKRAFKELKGKLPPLDYYVHALWDTDTILPWQHLQTEIQPATLEKHLAHSRALHQSD
jgi:radical SAM superfamily enzyme YgiQ (UPF0313 family)